MVFFTLYEIIWKYQISHAFFYTKHIHISMCLSPWCEQINVGNAKLRAVAHARSAGLLGPWLLTQNAITPHLHFGCKCHFTWSGICSRGEENEKDARWRLPRGVGWSDGLQQQRSARLWAFLAPNTDVECGKKVKVFSFVDTWALHVLAVVTQGWIRSSTWAKQSRTAGADPGSRPEATCP